MKEVRKVKVLLERARAKVVRRVMVTAARAETTKHKVLHSLLSLFVSVCGSALLESQSATSKNESYSWRSRSEIKVFEIEQFIIIQKQVEL